MPYQNLIEPFTLAFGSGSSASGSIFLGGNGIVGLGNTGTWTAAPLTFQTTLGSVPPDAGGTWVSIVPMGAGSEWAIPAGTMAIGTSFYPMNPQDFPALYYVRAVSGNVAGGTPQAAARNLVLLTRPL